MTTPRDDIDGLIERLRKWNDGWPHWKFTEHQHDALRLVLDHFEEAATQLDALQASVKELDEEATDWRGLYFDARSECVNMKGHYKNVCAAAATAEARATRLQQELDAMNDNHRVMARQMADLGRALIKAEQERDEAIAALKPFVDVAEEMLSRGWDASNVALALDNPNEPHRVTAGDFFAIRRLAGPEKEGK